MPFRVNKHDKTDGVRHVYCNFLPVCKCQTTVIFGIMREVSLLIYSFASLDRFPVKKRKNRHFRNGANALSFCLFVCFLFCFLFLFVCFFRFVFFFFDQKSQNFT